MRTLAILSALALLPVATAVGQMGSRYPGDPYGRYPQAGWGGYAPEARVWVDDAREYVRRGDRLRGAFSTSVDAYVAIVHIDPDGRLEFLYPSSPWDEAYVRGGRSYSLPYRNTASTGWMVRSGPGIGYLYMIASPAPLDYRYFQARGGNGWDWSYGGSAVQGDPFWAFEQITRALVPDWGYTPIVVDYYSYQVGGIHRYPAYACGSRYGGYSTQSAWGWGWGGGYTPSYYGSCDRLDPFLRDNPYYFDVNRYRGDRRTSFRRYGDPQPDHRFREDPRTTVERRDPAGSRSLAPSGDRATPAPGRGAGQSEPAPTQPARRPTLERRDPPRETGRLAPTPSAPPRRAAPSGNGGGASPSGSSEGSSERPATTQPRRRAAPDGNP